jgi:hypothetical protein
MRITFTLDRKLAEDARRLNIDISAAAQQGVATAVRTVKSGSDRHAYRSLPEQSDPSWECAEAWGDD